ncbi:MAG: DUF839 domain-containing protein, partial [Sphingomonas sp.]|uniref:PhoX family protein n=1 Tax=Sphingomonas sp. TaxID=28214 RepID=UPI00227400F0
MNDLTPASFGYTDGDTDTNRTDTVTLNELAAQRFSRRQTLRGGSAIVAATLGASVLSACDSNADSADPSVTQGPATSLATSSGRTVTLSGTPGPNGNQSWVQMSGPAVTLNGATSATATFLAPSVTAATQFVFRYYTTSAGNSTNWADTTVTVNAAQLGFTAVAKNKLDVVSVPTGYRVQVINRLGDPIAAGVPAYKNDGTDTNFAQRIGDHGDALYWYGLAATGTARDETNSTRGLIVQNHENITQQYLHPAGATSVGGVRPEAEAQKEMDCHGVAITEATEGANRAWTMVQGSSFNRRITPATPMRFNGPARGSDLLKTPFSTAGTDGRGTINNCANGTTPWGSALTCEENWAGYFRRSGDTAVRTAKEVTALSRYGVTSSSGSFGWSTVVPADSANTLFRRWD